MNVIKVVFLGSSLADLGKYMYALEKMSHIIKIMWWLKIRESLSDIRQPSKGLDMSVSHTSTVPIVGVGKMGAQKLAHGVS